MTLIHSPCPLRSTSIWSNQNPKTALKSSRLLNPLRKWHPIYILKLRTPYPTALPKFPPSLAARILNTIAVLVKSHLTPSKRSNRPLTMTKNCPSNLIILIISMIFLRNSKLAWPLIPHSFVPVVLMLGAMMKGEGVKNNNSSKK